LALFKVLESRITTKSDKIRGQIEPVKDVESGKSINSVGARNITAVPVYNKIEPSLERIE
jgi:hypothetical protein